MSYTFTVFGTILTEPLRAAANSKARCRNCYALVSGYGLAQRAKGSQCKAYIKIHHHYIGPEFDYLTDEADGDFVSAQLMVYHAEQMLGDQVSKIFL